MVAPRTALRLATAACAAGSLLLLFYYSDQTEHHAAVLDVGQLKAVMTAFWQRHRWTTYFANWQAAVTRAARDSAQATRSNATALFLTLQPAVWLLFWLARLLLKDVLYDVVICRGICSERAVRQVKRAVVRAVEWQLSRTRRQVAWEVGLLAAAAALVQFHRFLQRRRFGARLRRRARAARKSVSKVSFVLASTVQVGCVVSTTTSYMLLLLYLFARQTNKKKENHAISVIFGWEISF